MKRDTLRALDAQPDQRETRTAGGSQSNGDQLSASFASAKRLDSLREAVGDERHLEATFGYFMEGAWLQGAASRRWRSVWQIRHQAHELVASADAPRRANASRLGDAVGLVGGGPETA